MFGSPVLAPLAAGAACPSVAEWKRHVVPKAPCPSPPALSPLWHGRHGHICPFTTTSLPLLSLAKGSIPAGALPAPLAKVEDNDVLCAPAAAVPNGSIWHLPSRSRSCSAAFGKPQKSPFSECSPSPRWHAAEWLTRLSHFPLSP